MFAYRQQTKNFANAFKAFQALHLRDCDIRNQSVLTLFGIFLVILINQSLLLCQIDKNHARKRNCLR